MKTVGEFLQKERLRQSKSIERISEITKIRPSILDKIEKGEYAGLPSRTYVQGFVRAYAKALRIDADKALAFFRREYDLREKEHSSAPAPLDREQIVITPGKIFTVGGSILLILFLGVLVWQYQQFAGRPVLIIDYPPENLVVEREFVNVSGKTDPDAEVTVNGEKVGIGSDGIFQINVSLQQGANTITVTATSRVGKEITIEREVQVVPPTAEE